MNKETIESLLIQVAGTDVKVNEVRPIGGGNTSRAFAVKTSSGNFFIKTNRAGLVDMFEKEAKNLNCFETYCHIIRLKWLGLEPLITSVILF